MSSPGRRLPGRSDLATYAPIGYGRTVALIAADGGIDWMPMPNLDSTPVFARLVDDDHGGCIELTPEGEFGVDYTVARRYVAGTNVLQTTFTTDAGAVRVTDALVTGVAGRLPWAQLVRRIGRARADDDPPFPEVRGTFVAKPRERHMLAIVATDDEPLYLPEPATLDDAPRRPRRRRARVRRARLAGDRPRRRGESRERSAAAGRVRRPVARARLGHVGAARAAALHVVEDGLLAGAARCRAPRRAGRRPRPRSEDLGAYTMFPGPAALDTSVLLHAESGFDRGERMSRTIDALTAELGGGDGREALLYRYSGMRREEHTFVASAFWRAGALACVGRHDEAIAAMDELVGHANDVGIYSEMISDRDGSFWGNLPQALSHLAVVTAALTIRDVVPEARLADH